MSQSKPRVSRAPAATSEFNPYRDWLGLANADTVPNHYELLGLRECEADHHEILKAFESRFERTRRYEVGAKSDIAIAVLQQLSEAYIELTDAKRRQDYDRRLRQSSGRETDVAAAGDPPSHATGIIKGQAIPEATPPAVELNSLRPHLRPPARPKPAAPTGGTEGNLVPSTPTESHEPPPRRNAAVMTPPDRPAAPRVSDSKAEITRPLPADSPLMATNDDASATALAPLESAKAAPIKTVAPPDCSFAQVPSIDPDLTASRLLRHVGIGLAALIAIPLLPALFLLLFVVGTPLLGVVAAIELLIVCLLGTRITIHHGPRLIYRLLRATPRVIDRGLRAMVGQDNRILLYFLRFWCIVFALALCGWLGWGIWSWLAAAFGLQPPDRF